MSRNGSAGEESVLWEALRDVIDPELPVSVVDLGLIYGIRRLGRRVQRAAVTRDCRAYCRRADEGADARMLWRH